MCPLLGGRRCAVGKLANLLKSSGAVARESMGVRTETAKPAPPAQDGRLKGLSRPKEQVAEIPLDRIEPDPTQPRKEFEPDALAALAASLKTHGQQQPIRVRWAAEQGVYLI